jgi:hypothetical protein
MSGRTYEIKTVADFASVPADRLAACLQDFALWLEIRAEANRCLDSAKVSWVDIYLWKDDGRRDVTLRRVAGSSFEMPID